MKKIRVGIVGFGGICNGVHAPGYVALGKEKAEITAVCDIKPEKLALAKEKFGLSDDCLFTDYRDLIKSGLVDAIDIATPNDVHCEIAEAAIDAGLDFSIEKPIGLNFEQAKHLYDKVMASDVRSFICFSWRYRPYTRYVRDIIKSGQLGKLYHIYIRCIKNSGLWEGRKLEWRFDKDRAGTGVLGDLGSHMIDITRFWGEEFDGVYAQRGTYITERQSETSDEILPVTTDDWCNINGMTKSGVPVTIALSRTATTIDDLIEFEVMGENGRLKYKYEWKTGVGVTNEIEACIGKTDMEGAGTHKLIPPAKYEANQSESFINLLNDIEDEYTAHLEEGMECQKVLDAAELSCELGRYVKISEIK